jgi:TonB family protein
LKTIKRTSPPFAFPLGLGLDEQAVQSVSLWRFAPAEKDGKPVAALSTIEVRFQLGGSSPWRLGRVEFKGPAGTTRPVIQGGAGPRVTSGAAGAAATVTFGIDEHGSVLNPRVDSATNAEWGAEVTTAVSKWKFTPARGDSGAVGATCTMDFVRGN